MGKCSYKATDAWLLEIDKNLKILKELLPPDEFDLVNISQKNWEKYLKSEFDLYDKVIFNQSGTIFYTISAGSKSSIVKDRALMLSVYIDYVKEKQNTNNE